MDDQFIETPIRKPVQSGGKDSQMSKSTITAEPNKPAKQYRKSRGEHAKDIMIAVLITAVIAFIGGMHFSNNQHAETERAVTAATAVKK